MREHAADAAGLMKALGNESRLMILCMLTEGEQSVSDLNTIIPLSQSALSQQLARLRQHGARSEDRGAAPLLVGVAPEAVDVVHPIRDVHVTMLHLLGLDDNKLTYFHAGRYKQLSQFGGELISEIIA